MIVYFAVQLSLRTTVLLCSCYRTRTEMHRLVDGDGSVLRRSARLGYRANSSTTFASICDDADDQLTIRYIICTEKLTGKLPV